MVIVPVVETPKPKRILSESQLESLAKARIKATRIKTIKCKVQRIKRRTFKR